MLLGKNRPLQPAPGLEMSGSQQACPLALIAYNESRSMMNTQPHACYTDRIAKSIRLAQCGRMLLLCASAAMLAIKIMILHAKSLP